MTHNRHYLLASFLAVTAVTASPAAQAEDARTQTYRVVCTDPMGNIVLKGQAEQGLSARTRGSNIASVQLTDGTQHQQNNGLCIATRNEEPQIVRHWSDHSVRVTCTGATGEMTLQGRSQHGLIDRGGRTVEVLLSDGTRHMQYGGFCMSTGNTRSATQENAHNTKAFKDFYHVRCVNPRGLESFSRTFAADEDIRISQKRFSGPVVTQGTRLLHTELRNGTCAINKLPAPE